MSERQVPVREGDVITLECKSTGSKGDGIFKKDGFTIFAPSTQVGQKYKLRITGVRQTFGFAEVV